MNDKNNFSTENNLGNQQAQQALNAIKKKLLGKKLSYKEIFALMDEVANEKLGPVLTTYFVAAGFKNGFNEDELYYLTKAMANTGSMLKFDGIVADKHSTGGLAGTRTTMILVPIIAAAGYKIPKNSSRAITTPSGTADTMEVLAPVTFTPDKIQRIVDKIGGCIIWGGHLGLAPADDIIIQVETPLSFESFDKIIVSIMAKKIASGATHLVLDVPVGHTLKIKHNKDAELIKSKFRMLAKKFSIKIDVDINHAREPAGHSVGPALEAKDALKVLQLMPDRPPQLEAKTLRLAGKLLDLCLSDSKDKNKMKGEDIAKSILYSGKAWKKMHEIIAAQGGNPNIIPNDIETGKYIFDVTSHKSGKITGFDNLNLTSIAKILGCPQDKKSGIYLHKRMDEKIIKKDVLCTLYSSDKWKLNEAKLSLEHLPIYKIE